MKSWKGAAINCIWSQSSGVHILVGSRSMVSVKMNCQCTKYSNYQVSFTITIDNFVDKTFCKKQYPENFTCRACSPWQIPAINAYGIHSRKFKLGSHLPKKFFYLLQWKPFKNDENCFLFHLKSSFHFQDIYLSFCLEFLVIWEKLLD